MYGWKEKIGICKQYFIKERGLEILQKKIKRKVHGKENFSLDL